MEMFKCDVYDDIVIQMANKFAISIKMAKDLLNDMHSYNYKRICRYFGGVQSKLISGTPHKDIVCFVYSTINTMSSHKDHEETLKIGREHMEKIMAKAKDSNAI